MGYGQRSTFFPSFLTAWILGAVLISQPACNRDRHAASRAQHRTSRPSSKPLDGPSPLIHIPGTCFQMGSGAGQGQPEERPRHEVCLDAFSIERHKVTHQQYARCVAAKRCRPPASRGWDVKYRRPRAPVVGVSWEDARAYCRFLGRRLPTEAEWELAACGTDGRTYPWGEDPPSCDFVHFKGCSPKRPLDVERALKNRGPLGTRGMVGNVWEWIADRYAANAYGNHARRNPQGPTMGLQRVIRGGSFVDPATFLRCRARYHWKPGARLIDVGFRCAK